MKVAMRLKSATSEPLEKRFNRFAKALMAVPKKELDKEISQEPEPKRKNPKRRKP